jgi:hypothetical protein
MAFPTGSTLIGTLTIDHTKVGSGGVTNFTLLVTEVHLASLGVFTGAKSDGTDIRFTTASDGTGLLTADIILFDTVNSKCEIRVGTINLSSVADVVIYVWWGDTSLTAQTGSNAYVTDFHLYPLQTNSNDRGQSPNNGTDTSITYGTDAKIQKGADFNGSSSGVGLSATTYPLATSRSMMAWIKLDNLPASSCAIAARFLESSGQNGEWLWIINSAGALNYQRRPGTSTFSFWTDVRSINGAIGTGQWYHVAIVDNYGVGQTLYINGVNANSTTQNPTTTVTPAGTVIPRIGRSHTARFFDGLIDDFQWHQGIVLSAAWVLTEYNQSNNPATFITAALIGGGTQTVNPEILIATVSQQPVNPTVIASQNVQTVSVTLEPVNVVLEVRPNFQVVNVDQESSNIILNVSNSVQTITVDTEANHIYVVANVELGAIDVEAIATAIHLKVLPHVQVINVTAVAMRVDGGVSTFEHVYLFSAFTRTATLTSSFTRQVNIDSVLQDHSHLKINS